MAEAWEKVLEEARVLREARQMAVDDGVLVDVTSYANEDAPFLRHIGRAGTAFPCEVALTWQLMDVVQTAGPAPGWWTL